MQKTQNQSEPSLTFHQAVGGLCNAGLPDRRPDRACSLFVGFLIPCPKHRVGSQDSHVSRGRFAMCRSIPFACVIVFAAVMGPSALGQESKAAKATREKLKQKISVD